MRSENNFEAIHNFSNRLIAWYELNKRQLPWRESTDPYVIWLSEIILQQTRVQQGLPYFNKFLDAFPNIHSFASASETEILKLWQGLGYYSRARNMLACAKQVIDQFDGRFPETYEELIKLKGVGKYTAAAIASFAFKQPVPVIDGNVYRVLSRLYGIDDDISLASSHKSFYEMAESSIPKDKPNLYNQAMMEIGSLQCRPKNPLCSSCPFVNDCFAHKNSMQDDLPVKTKVIAKKNRYFNYLILVHENRVHVRVRKDKDIWKGMYEFYLIETEGQEDENSLLINKANFLSGQGNLVNCSGIYKHILTHQRIFARFYVISFEQADQFESMGRELDLETLKIEDLQNLPVSRLIDRYLNEESIFFT